MGAGLASEESQGIGRQSVRIEERVCIMSQAQRLGQTRMASSARVESPGVSEWWWWGVVTGLTAVVELCLGARLLVQLSGARGILADLAYFLGGIFQMPFDRGSSAAASRAVFEPETVLAMVVYASLGSFVPVAGILLKVMAWAGERREFWEFCRASFVGAGRLAAEAGRTAVLLTCRFLAIAGPWLAEASRKAYAALLRFSIATKAWLAWNWTVWRPVLVAWGQRLLVAQGRARTVAGDKLDGWRKGLGQTD
jgi:hypothetical protein